jgi:hypothetical protein
LLRQAIAPCGRRITTKDDLAFILALFGIEYSRGRLVSSQSA